MNEPNQTNEPNHDARRSLRRTVYTLWIVLGTAVMLGRILAVDSIDRKELQRQRFAKIPKQLDEKRQRLEKQGVLPDRIDQALDKTEIELRRQAWITRPFLSANDRSRWCTVRALVEPEMRVDGAPYAIDRVLEEPNWDTIDMVKHDGHLYSSKPPLFPTLLAAEYWVVHAITGKTLGDEPYALGRFLLISVNVVPLVIMFFLLARLIERFGTTDWGRLFVMAAAMFGTFLTTFAVVVNNHIPAAASMTIALYAAVQIIFDGKRSWIYFALAGLFAAFAAANELPALAFLGLIAVVLLWKAPKRTLWVFVPASAIVVYGFFATNWIAHQSLRPPYMHRSETNLADNWYDYTYMRNGREVESYWRNRVGIDQGEPSRAVYALHTTVGHHGIFSLTPIWLLSIVGLVIWLLRTDDRGLRELALFVATISLVCLVFYLMRPQDDRNYGGMTCAFRWMFWFAPMWLVVMLPAVDWMAGRKWLRGLALVLLGASVLSASYPTWNPWTHPWILDGLHYLKWIQI